MSGRFDVWVWREDTMSERTGGWRLDEYGTWTWDEYGSPLPRGARSASGPALALLPSPVEALTGAPAPGGHEETPIFHAVSDDQSRRAGMRRIEGEPSWAAIPEPNPGSGPLPIQHVDRPAEGGRRLAAVPTVPAPPGPVDEVARETAESPEDELRRRAERRRRPQAEETASAGAGRHAMRREEPRTGRHALGG